MAPLSHILSSLACLQSILQVKCDQFYVNKGPGRDTHRTQIDENHLTKSPDYVCPGETKKYNTSLQNAIK